MPARGGLYATFAQGGFYLNGYAGGAYNSYDGGEMPLEEVRAEVRTAASLMGTLGAVTSFIGAA